MKNYILVDKKIVVEPDLEKFAKWYSYFSNSTVFLGMDHNFSSSGEPVLFETMIFDLPEGQEYQTRCSTWDEAIEMHNKALEYAGSKL